MRWVPLVFGAVLSVAGQSWAQGNPVGPEFRVNTYTTGSQTLPQVASDASGNFVVVWQGDGQDGSGRGIFGQRYSSSGAPLGAEFRVNTYTTAFQHRPSVAGGSSGNFVVTWMSDAQDGSLGGVFGQRYAGSGAPLGPEFRINTYTTDDQGFSSVAADSAGNFVVVWSSVAQDGSYFGVFGQRFDSSGTPLGPEFRVNSYTTNGQSSPSVAADSVGNFVVVWNSVTQDGSYFGVYGQRYSAGGTPLGPEFRVNTFTTSYQFNGFVASDPAGNFVVAWVDFVQDGHFSGIFGQRYASSGIPLGPEFRVNTYTSGEQFSPAIVSDPSGNFVVCWDSTLQEGLSSGVYAQRYASSGTPLGSEFRVNTFTPQSQGDPSVAADAAGNFVVVWRSSAGDGSSQGIFGQRYAQIVPAELMSFTIE